jgi:glycosyltransferase involved in cell wall biosynthesis
MVRLALILPAYNEEHTLEATIRGFHANMPGASIWVVDNKSTDQTRVVAEQVLSDLGCRGGVIDERRKGKGNAVRRGFMDVDADVYVLADADLTYPADQVDQLLAPVLGGSCDMVVGDRHSAGNYAAENKRVLNGFGNKLVRALVNILFRSNLADIMSGYRVMSRRFVKNYPILSEGFEVETEMTLHALDKRFRVVEVPVNYKDRPPGSVSKLNTLQDGARVVATIFNILRYYRPLLFFGGLGLLFALGGLYAGTPVIEEWVRTKYINRIPLAILASGLEVIAIIMFAIGLILDSIAHQSRLDYERDLLRHGGGGVDA